MKTTVAAIDFGTSKIVTLVAENSGTQRCDIVGAGIENYDGYLEEGWNNPGMVDEAIRKSIHEAEEQSKRKLREIYVGVPGMFTRVYATEVVVDLKGTDPRVTAGDVKAIFKAADDSLGQLSGCKIHSSPAWFMVDDGKKTLEPVGLKGRELRALISVVVANRFFVDDVNARLSDMGIKVNGFFSTTAGEAMLYLPEEDRDRTAVLIDIGYLNTEVMVVEGDALIFLDTLEVGGGDIAADLAMGLDISLSAAEKLKREYVFSITAAEKMYEVVDGQRPLSFSKEQMAEIIEPRVDEIAEMIETTIRESGIKLGNWSNIYLTGGGLSFNENGKTYLAGKLQQPVRDVPKRTTKLSSHSFSSTLGLMDLIIDIIEQQHQSSEGFGGKVKDFFRSLLGG
ncbi:MAG: hypothetical protein IKK21_12305 [Clostridia bacterium]|nr:hypothetical protein [Clostridia bacterium]